MQPTLAARGVLPYLTGLASLLVSASAPATPRQDPPPENKVTVSDQQSKGDEHTNRLAKETSPYLLQHKNNPVDWYPWGQEAFDAAKKANKPIFLSIGYSACHWCHVMEHESFENEKIAAFLNEHFISIKVDREERPDVDEVYMQAVIAYTGHGGWPLSVWLTPDRQPFYGGTYFPPEDRRGMPGFKRVLEHLSKAWESDNERVLKTATEWTKFLRETASRATTGSWPEGGLRAGAADQLAASFDSVWGGFGGPPKFPHTGDIRLLLRHFAKTGDEKARDMAELSLDRMWRGGMYDHVGGGFHRYSTDGKWLVPHFEKMLYDNALLARTYLEGWQVLGKNDYRRVAIEILEYIEREMTSKDGAFYSTTDADSEGEEGKFFVWKPAEIEEILGKQDAARFDLVYGVSAAGNFEHGTSILNLEETFAQRAKELGTPLEKLEEQMREARAKIYAARLERIPPGLDDKILCDWNGLMITTLAEAAFVLDDPRWIALAEKACDFVWKTLRTKEGQLLRAYREGRARFDATLADHAYLLEGLVRVFEVTGKRERIEQARWIADRMLKEFRDTENGAFFNTAATGEKLIARFKEGHDGAVPSANAVAAVALARLYQITGEDEYRKAAESTLEAFAQSASSAPGSHPTLIIASEWILDPVTTVIVSSGEGAEELLAPLRSQLRPDILVVRAAEGEKVADLAPLLAEKSAEDGAARAYVCRNFTCRMPSKNVDELMRELEAAEGDG